MPLTPPERLDLHGFTLRAWTRADAQALRLALAASDAHLRTFTPWVVDGRVPGLSLEDRLDPARRGLCGWEGVGLRIVQFRRR